MGCPPARPPIPPIHGFEEEHAGQLDKSQGVVNMGRKPVEKERDTRASGYPSLSRTRFGVGAVPRSPPAVPAVDEEELVVTSPDPKWQFDWQFAILRGPDCQLPIGRD